MYHPWWNCQCAIHEVGCFSNQIFWRILMPVYGKVTCYLCTTVGVFYFYDRNSGQRNRQDWNSRIILMPSWCSDRKKLKNDQRAYFYFQAIDAGDTIFVHTFGAYFGLGVSRILYTKSTLDHKNEVKNIFLWLTPCSHGLFFRIFFCSS